MGQMGVLRLERARLPVTVDAAIAILTVVAGTIAGIRGVRGAIEGRRLPGRAVRHSDPSFKGVHTRAAAQCTLAARSNSWYRGHLGWRHSLASARVVVVAGVGDDHLGDLSPAGVAAAAGWYCWGVLVVVDRTFSIFTVFCIFYNKLNFQILLASKSF